MTPSNRSLATVLFTDIVGSTQHATQVGDREWGRLLDEHHDRVRMALRRFGGRELNTAGDGFLAVFPTPAMAIACADAIRSAVDDIGLRVRCGIHMGEVEGTGKRVGGIGVHIAARVMAEAGPSEVLVSRTVRDAVEGAGFEFEDRGGRELKGVTGERRLYAVTRVPAGLGETQPRTAAIREFARRPWVLGMAAGVLIALVAAYVTRRGPALELTPEEALAEGAPAGIAVLPFSVNDPRLSTWREGMVDLLSVNLDGVPGLRPITSRTVLARWSREAPDGADLDTSLAIARRTGARYALVGSAVSIGGEVRFSADVYDARSGDLLGSAQAQGSPDSVLALVDRLSLDVVRALPQGEAGILPRVHLEGVTTASLPALKSYLEGEAVYRRGDLEAAMAAYERAVAADSTFSLALRRLSEVCWWGIPAPDCLEYLGRAMRHIERLSPREATLVRASEAMSRNTDESVDSLRALIRRKPDDAEAWNLLGETYRHVSPATLIDRREEAAPAFERAIQLDPTFAMYYEHLMEFAFADGDSARARSLIETHGRLAPGSEWDRAYRTAFALSFADSAGRARSLASLDTVETADLFAAAVQGLWHPATLPTQTEVLRILRERPDAESWWFNPQFDNRYRRGQFDEAMRVLRSDGVPSVFRRSSTYTLYRSGMSLSPEQIEEEFAASRADTTSEGAYALLVAGAYAADRGRWIALDAARDRARVEAGRRRAAGDTAAARMFDGAGRALEDYGLWKRGRPEDALPRLEAVQRDMRGRAGGEGALNEAVRWWLGEILVELGRPDDALVYFRTFEGPFARFEAAKIYAELGEPEKAKESYEYALLAWRDADPELRPRIEAARQALAELQRPLQREAP